MSEHDIRLMAEAVKLSAGLVRMEFDRVPVAEQSSARRYFILLTDAMAGIGMGSGLEWRESLRAMLTATRIHHLKLAAIEAEIKRLEDLEI